MPARIRFATSLTPDEIVARLADQSQGYTAPRDGNLSKIGYRIEVTPRGFKLFKVAGRFLGNPPRTIAVLDATTSQTGAGTVINGEARLPYPYLTMFCVFWLATIGSSLFPDKGMFVAALILWGGFGSLFTLAQRVDAGRSVSTFASRLEIALGAPLATSLPDVEIPTAPNLPPQFVRPPLFSSRLEAGIFLAGLTAFWGGFLILGLMQATMDGHSAHHGPTGPGEVAVFVLILVGGLLATIAQRGLLVRMTQTTIPTAGTMMRMIMPGTLSGAARKLGLNGPVVAGILYLVLVLGIVTFLSSLTVR
ncbi:MAG TPA: hypothetical protein VHK65_00505 [Candidatus Dormibacteraeota bacterium]|nr:hypothetical protein [Candidatus Dormibacteraeota bacterium]